MVEGESSSVVTCSVEIALGSGGTGSSKGRREGGRRGEVMGETDGGRLACSKAVAKACMEAHRSFGSFARALSTTLSILDGMVDSWSCKAGGGVCKWWYCILRLAST